MASNNDYDDCESLSKNKRSRGKQISTGKCKADRHKVQKYYQGGLIKGSEGLRKSTKSTIRHKKLHNIDREKERNNKPTLVSSGEEDSNAEDTTNINSYDVPLELDVIKMVDQMNLGQGVDNEGMEKVNISSDNDTDGRLYYIKMLGKLIDLNMPSKIESNRSTEAYTKRLYFLEKRRYESEKGVSCNQLFCNESFWLELQHRFKNRTGDRIKNIRQQTITSLSKFGNFRVQGVEIDASDIQREKIYSISKSYLQKIKLAHDQVSQVLVNYHYLLSFWPTTANMVKYMSENCPQWHQEKKTINENIETMQAWQTCYEWLNWKTRQICQIVGITGHCLHNFIIVGYNGIETEDQFDSLNEDEMYHLPDLAYEEFKDLDSSSNDISLDAVKYWMIGQHLFPIMPIVCNPGLAFHDSLMILTDGILKPSLYPRYLVTPIITFPRVRSHSLNMESKFAVASNIVCCESGVDVLTDGECESKFEVYADISRRRYGFAKVCSTIIDSVKPMLTKFQHLLSITKDENRLPLMFSYADALKKEGAKSRASTPNPVGALIFSENVPDASLSSYSTAILDTQEYPTIPTPISSKLTEKRQSIFTICSPTLSSNPSQQCLSSETNNDLYHENSEMNLEMLQSVHSDQECSNSPQIDDIKGLLGLKNKVAARLFLPPLLPHYLFLARFPVKIMHCCIRKMLSASDSQRISELSIITIKHKILDFKDALQRTMEAREFLRNITYGINFQIYKFRASNTKEFAPKQDIEHSDFMRSSLKEIDSDLSILLRHYIDCLKELLKKWSPPTSACKFGQSEPRRILEEEWNFVKTYCHSIKQEEEIVASSFCNLAEYLFDLLQTRIESHYKLNIDYDVSPTGDTPLSHSEDDACASSSIDNRRMSKSCQSYMSTCKIVQSQLKQATDFAKRLRADLEISIQLELNTNYSMNDFLMYLSRTKHKMVELCSPDEMLMPDVQHDLTLIIPDESCCHLNELLHSLVTGFSLQPKDECVVTSPHSASTSKINNSSVSREYILIINKKSKMNWLGDKILFFYSLDMGNLKQRIESSSIVFIARRPDELSQQLTHLFQYKIPNDHARPITFKDVIQSCSDGQMEACHYNSKRTLNALKSKSIDIGNTLQNFFISNEQEIFQDSDSNISLNRVQEDTVKNSIKNSYSITFEFYRDLIKLCTGDAFRNTLKNSILNLLEKWFHFSKLFEPNEKGTVPRWANDGLNFLLHFCQSRVVINMTTTEWQDFKRNIDNFVEFIVGRGHRRNSFTSAKSTTSSKLVTSRSWLATPKPDIIRGIETTVNKIDDWRTDYGENRAFRSAFSEPNQQIQHSEVSLARGAISLGESVCDSHSTNKSTDGSSVEDDKARKRISLKQNIEQLEIQLNDKQRQNNLIGFVRDSNSDMASSPYIKKAPFQWSKKGLIGQGHSGTVYKVCNLDTMEIMAMKEIVINEPFKQDRIESELLCKLKYPSLLKYFGVDISLSHVRIFTEYCDSGSLSQVSILDIPEIIVRQWSKQVLDAIVFLHDHKIVHRDVKPDNIFLINSEDGDMCNAKLGDFGVAKCLNNHEEGFTDIQGTMMYMAPEVVVVDSIENVSNKGYNHKVDIWSFGCVVLYMITGKSPWPDLEQMTIYYNLGMKKQPFIPPVQPNSRMTNEARDFISSSLIVNSIDRPEAIELKNFHFVKLADP